MGDLGGPCGGGCRGLAVVQHGARDGGGRTGRGRRDPRRIDELPLDPPHPEHPCRRRRRRRGLPTRRRPAPVALRTVAAVRREPCADVDGRAGPARRRRPRRGIDRRRRVHAGRPGVPARGVRRRRLVVGRCEHPTRPLDGRRRHPVDHARGRRGRSARSTVRRPHTAAERAARPRVGGQADAVVAMAASRRRGPRGGRRRCPCAFPRRGARHGDLAVPTDPRLPHAHRGDRRTGAVAAGAQGVDRGAPRSGLGIVVSRPAARRPSLPSSSAPPCSAA